MPIAVGILLPMRCGTAHVDPVVVRICRPIGLLKFNHHASIVPQTHIHTRTQFSLRLSIYALPCPVVFNFKAEGRETKDPCGEQNSENIEEETTSKDPEERTEDAEECKARKRRQTGGHVFVAALSPDVTGVAGVSSLAIPSMVPIF